MRTIKLTIAYDGTDYSGWQTQSGPRTLQETFETVLAKITGEPLRVAASGRTDAGVHALGQVVSFRTSTHLSPETLQRALNSELPRDVAVLAAAEAPLAFHARRHATRKRYRYVLRDGRVPNVFERGHCWHSYQRLDHQAMQRSSLPLVGRHDFVSFQTTGSPRQSTVRTILALDVRRDSDDDHRLLIEVEADGFLYNMVRAIVGTLIEVGRGQRADTWPAEVLAARHRRAAGQTAPAQGLFLLWVAYDKPLEDLQPTPADDAAEESEDD